MKHKIGDIVRFRFSTDMVAIVSGHALGTAFAPLFHFAPDDDIVLATRENGTVFAFKDNNTDWEVVEHFDISSILKSIVEAKEV